ncbi:glycoside hydrolase, partial [Kalaharituber pfeilii]
YIGTVSSATTSSHSGVLWAKIYDDGFTPSDKQWATDRFNKNGGKATFKLPSTLASGDYLLRTEFIALQGAAVVGSAQFYVGCFQLRITGAGSPTPTSVGVSFPGYHKANHPRIL